MGKSELSASDKRVRDYRHVNRVADDQANSDSARTTLRTPARQCGHRERVRGWRARMKDIDRPKERRLVTATVVMRTVELGVTVQSSSWQIMPKQSTDDFIRAAS
jgi:hypothetical protein